MYCGGATVDVDVPQYKPFYTIPSFNINISGNGAFKSLIYIFLFKEVSSENYLNPFFTTA